MLCDRDSDGDLASPTVDLVRLEEASNKYGGGYGQNENLIGNRFLRHITGRNKCGRNMTMASRRHVLRYECRGYEALGTIASTHRGGPT
jgi:hypothetical protein